MPSDAERVRPPQINWIGAFCLVGAVLLALRAAVNLAIFFTLRPTIPTLLETFGGGAAGRLPYVPWLLRFYTVIETAQLVGGTLAAIVAVAFLRLHRWARRGLRIVCGFGLVWVAYFTTLWVSILGRATSLGTPPERATRTLILGLALLLAITAGLVAMIVTLGSPQVRAAFGKEAAGRNLGA